MAKSFFDVIIWLQQFKLHKHRVVVAKGKAIYTLVAVFGNNRLHVYNLDVARYDKAVYRCNKRKSLLPLHRGITAGRCVVACYNGVAARQAVVAILVKKLL